MPASAHLCITPDRLSTLAKLSPLFRLLPCARLFFQCLHRGRGAVLLLVQAERSAGRPSPTVQCSRQEREDHEGLFLGSVMWVLGLLPSQAPFITYAEWESQSELARVFYIMGAYDLLTSITAGSDDLMLANHY